MTNPTTNSALRRVRVPAYFVFSLAMIYEFVDVGIALRPYNPGVATWRFSAIGVTSNAFARPLVLLVLLLAVAAISSDRKTLRAIGVAGALGVAVFLAMLVDFSLGALQIKGQVPAAEAQKFLIATGVAIAKMVTLGFASGLVAYSAFRAASGAAPAGRQSNVVMPRMSDDPTNSRASASAVSAT